MCPTSHPGVAPGRGGAERGAGLCAAWAVELSSGDGILVHARGLALLPGRTGTWGERNPGGRHLAYASVWDVSCAYSHPPATVREWPIKVSGEAK